MSVGGVRERFVEPAGFLELGGTVYVDDAER